jgi:AMP nucleosidase
LFIDPTDAFQRVSSPEEAVERLADLHAAATNALRDALDRYLASSVTPGAAERARFRYPELRLTYQPDGPPPTIRRAYAKFHAPGVYATTVTQPAFFREYLLELLHPLVRDYRAMIEVGVSRQEIPYPYVFERGDELARGGISSADLARHFPTPLLSVVGDEVVDSTWTQEPGEALPLSLFDAVRVDYSLRRLVHYTGTDWRTVQPWILLTNYHRYVDQFVRWALDELAREGPFQRLVMPGGIVIERGRAAGEIDGLITESPWHRFQMPA